MQETVLRKISAARSFGGLCDRIMHQNKSLEHWTEKWKPVFGKIRCTNKEHDSGQRQKSRPTIAFGLNLRANNGLQTLIAALPAGGRPSSAAA
jgi:hypothetical protein